MIDIADLDKTWDVIQKNIDPKTDSELSKLMDAIQHGLAVIHYVTPSDLLSMPIEEAKKVAAINEMNEAIAKAQGDKFGDILASAFKKKK